nr:hypothetical protein [uncultured Clostridium sp.]
MNVEQCIDFLGYRLDAIHQPMYNLSVPFVNGITANNTGLQINRHRLAKMALPNEVLKKVERKWQVGIWDDTNKNGVTVFEGDTILEALSKAVVYVKNQSGNEGYLQEENHEIQGMG